MKEALKKLEEQEKAAMDAATDSKRKYNSLAGGENVTPEEMEAWRMKKSRADDPMTAMEAQKSKGGYDLL